MSTVSMIIEDAERLRAARALAQHKAQGPRQYLKGAHEEEQDDDDEDDDNDGSVFVSGQ